MAELIGLGFERVLAGSFGGNHEWPLKVDSHRRLKADGVSLPQGEEGESSGHCYKQHNAAKCSGDRQFGRASPPGSFRRPPNRGLGSGAHVVAPLRPSVGGEGKLTGAPEGIVDLRCMLLVSVIVYQTCKLGQCGSMNRIALGGNMNLFNITLAAPPPSKLFESALPWPF